MKVTGWKSLEMEVIYNKVFWKKWFEFSNVSEKSYEKSQVLTSEDQKKFLKIKRDESYK